MSFSSDIKKEITTLPVGRKCCQLSLIAGFMRFSGSITLTGGRMGIKLTTDNPAVARLFASQIKDYFGARTNLAVGESAAVRKGRSYGLEITPEMNAEPILREVGILAVREGSNYITDGLNQDIIRKRCCKKSALRGIFLAAGSVTDPAKGYHLELSCESDIMAKDVSKLLGSFGLKPKTVPRRGKRIVYIKDGEQIMDFLSIIGVSSQLFRYQDVRITRQLRGQANRINNCENANVEKTVGAAGRQLEAILRIQRYKGLETLPDKLYETAKKRLENPELSLGELAQLFDPPISKAGLNHRLEKLGQIAERIEIQ